MRNDLDGLADCVAIVTGGGRGIGRAVCERLSAAGAHVVIADHDEAMARETCDALQKKGARAEAVPMDVTDRSGVVRLVQAALEAFEKIDILVNCAGITSIHPFVDIPEED